MIDPEPKRSIKLEYFPHEKTILREDLQIGDCIGYLMDSNYTEQHVGVIQSFIGDTISRKSTIVLTDGKHIPLKWVHHRLKSNQIEITK